MGIGDCVNDITCIAFDAYIVCADNDYDDWDQINLDDNSNDTNYSNRDKDDINDNEDDNYNNNSTTTTATTKITTTATTTAINDNS